jgi:type II secretory pathway pseudopilin PulG
MRILLLLLFIAALSIFWLQNTQVVALFLFGTLVPLQLSLGSWVVVFVILGIITGILVQVLGRGSAFWHNRNKKQRIQTPSKQTDTRLYRDTEWEQKLEEDDWEIEKPPRRTPTPQAVKPKPAPTPAPPQVEQPTTTTTRTYPKPPNRDSKEGDVYDANFRVLNPPYQPPSSNNNELKDVEDEDWI